MRLLITGASGQLGAYLLRELRQRHQEVTGWSGSQSGEWFGSRLHSVNLLDHDAVSHAFREARPDIVIHAAGITTVAGCYQNSSLAKQINTDATTFIAELSQVARARLVFTSTDLVFDGKAGPYSETSTPAPLSIYGASKLAAEKPVLECPNGAVVRLSLLFGPALNGRPGFFDAQVAALRERRPITLFADEWRTPLGLHAAAQALLAIAESDITGVMHVGGPERLTRLETGQRLAAFLGVDSSALVSADRDDIPSPEPRPQDVSLNSSYFRVHFPAIPWSGFEDGLRELSMIFRF